MKICCREPPYSFKTLLMIAIVFIGINCMLEMLNLRHSSCRQLDMAMISEPWRNTNPSVYRVLNSEQGYTMYNKQMVENISEAKSAVMTVVSAYINIGAFRKSKNDPIRNESVYIQWMTMFKSLLNPLIFYTDSEAAIEFVLKIRRGLPTKVVKVNKNSTWAWSLLDQIEKCQSKHKGYLPSHFNPEYVAMMHSKFEIVRDACEENHFSTKYITWLDAGTYRDIIKSSKDGVFTPFVLRPPELFDSTKIAMNQVGRWESPKGFLVIMDQSLAMIAGCIFLGEVDVMKRFTDDYRKHVEMILKKYDRINTDEQILGAMYAAADSPFEPAVQLQLYLSPQPPLCWVCLAWHMRNRGILGDEYTIYNKTFTVGRLPGMTNNTIVTDPLI